MTVSRLRTATIICPCCGYPTLEDRGAYEICLLCWWEDDGQDDARADEVWGGPNGDLSLTEARANFRSHLTSFRIGTDTRIGGTDVQADVDAKRAILAALDQLRAGVTGTDANRLWITIERHEATLEAETERKARDYEGQSDTRGTV